MNRQDIRNLIMKEIEAMGEDVLVPRPMARLRGTPPLSAQCEQCGSHSMYEGECSECGYMKNEYMTEGACILHEGSCGCSSSPSDVMTDYSIDTMSMFSDIHKHNHNNYMAKPSLYKVAKYAKKLLDIIPDGYELDDWQRHKIAQISDDISEVYHSLDYDFSDGDM